MTKVRLLFFLICFCLSTLSFTPRAVASQIDTYIEKANHLELAKDPFWRDLLHFKGKASKILDKYFFLSDRGRIDPQAELEATIKTYFTQEHNIKREWGDKNIVCIFPARYAWLNEKLQLPNYKCDETNCPGLHDWARLDEIDTVSVFYVSGYLGNPASSFGHVLLNFKLKGRDELFGLLDTSITYGATVPFNENMIMYVMKGLFGGYSASFSDKYFYTHDQVYSNREFRDMWEYTLELTDDEKKMLIYHVAELLTKRFKYYFLSSNCGYGMAVLLDIFLEEDVYNFDYPVYVPEELFQRLQSIDTKRREHGKAGLIKDIKYIPSARRHLFYQTKGLTNQERNVYQSITNSPDEDIKPKLEELDVEDRIKVLNALLAYQYYKLMAGDEDNVDQRLKEYKDKILLERLSLPAKKEEAPAIPEIPSPKEVSPPSSFNLGFVTEKDNEPFGTLGITIFKKESVGLNALEFNDLVALSLNLGIHDGSSEVFVDSFDALKVSDYRTFYIKEAKESPFSWRFRAGVDRYKTDDDVLYDYEADGGAGLVKKVNDIGILYGFMNASLHTLDQHYRAGPSAGFVVGKKFLKLQVDYGLEFGLEDFEYEETLNTKLQYQINRQNALQVSFEKNNRERVAVSYIFYW